MEFIHEEISMRYNIIEVCMEFNDVKWSESYVGTAVHLSSIMLMDFNVIAWWTRINVQFNDVEQNSIV